MTIYAALASRAELLARRTDELPSLASLIRTVSIGVARWSERTREDVQTARVRCLSDGPTFVIWISPGRSSAVPIFRGLIASTHLTAARFVQSNPNAIDVLERLSQWALQQIDAGSVKFETRWSPSSDGFLAISAHFAVAQAAS